MDLHAVGGTLWRQRLIVLLAIFAGLAIFAWMATARRSFDATATILTAGGGLDSGTLDPRKDPIAASITPTDLPSLLHSSTVLRRTGERLRLTPAQTQRLAGEVKAKPTLSSSVLPITVTDADPRRAVVVVNALAEELQRFEQQIAEARYDGLVHDLSAQLAQRRARLQSIDRQIAAATGADPYLSADQGAAALQTRLQQLDAQRDTVRATMIGDAASAAIAARRPELAHKLAGREITQNDPLFQNLRGQFGKDRAQLSQTEAGYTETYPGLAGLRTQVQREEKSLANAERRATSDPALSQTYVTTLLDKNKAEAAYAGDRSQLAALDAQIRAATSHLLASHADTIAVAALRRERDANEHAYATISDRSALAIADRSQAASVNAIVILDRAVTASPSLFSRPAVLGSVIAILVLWLAITLAFVADASDRRLRSRTTVEDLYGAPVLTHVG